MKRQGRFGVWVRLGSIALVIGAMAVLRADRSAAKAGVVRGKVAAAGGAIAAARGRGDAATSAHGLDQQAWNVEQVGQIGGSTNAVAVQGKYAYIGVGPRLVVLDISGPTQPKVLGETEALAGIVDQVAVQGAYAYVAASEDRLRIINVRDPANPHEVGSYSTISKNWISGIFVAGMYAFVAAGDVTILDVRDPADLREVRVLDTPGYARDVSASETYAYVADESGGLQIIDVHDPAHPLIVGSSPTPEPAMNVYVAGKNAYVTTRDITGSGNLRIIDVNDPTNPNEIGLYDDGWGGLNGVYVAGTYAFVACYFNGLKIIDIRDPTQPRAVGAFGTVQGLTVDVVVGGMYAYVASGSDGLAIIDLSDLPNSREIAAYKTPDYAHDVYVVGTTAYVADRTAGLQIINVSDATNPRKLGAVDTLSDTMDVFVAGTNAYVADGKAGLRVIDVRDATTPRLLGTFNTPGNAVGVFEAGGYAYVADGLDGGLQIIDVRDPANPSEIGSLETGGEAQDVYVEGGYAYVAVHGSGVWIVDVRDPANPRKASSLTFPELSGLGETGIDVAGLRAYVVDGYYLWIIDIRDPANPRLLGFVPTLAENGVHIVGTYAYVVDPFAGLQLIDVRDPANPRKAEGIDLPESGTGGVYVVGAYAYVADGYEGLHVIDVRNLANSRSMEFFGAKGNSEGVYISGSTAFMANLASGGLRIVDVGNEAGPREVGNIDTPGYAHDVYVAGTTAYVADGFGGLRIVDIRDRTNPREVGAGPTPTDFDALGVFVTGMTAYVAGGKFGLRIIDVSDPTKPRELGAISTPDEAWGIFVAGTTAYVADQKGGLRIVDVRVPSNPREEGFIKMPGNAVGIFVAGMYAYVADGAAGLRIIDVHDPTNVSEVGVYDTPDPALDVFVTGTIAYVADGFGGLHVIDVRDPANPREVGFTDTPSVAGRVYVVGTTAYVTDANGGLQILRFNPLPPPPADTCDRAAALLPNHALNQTLSDANDARIVTIDVPNPFTRVDITATDPDDQLSLGIYRTCDTDILGSYGPGSGQHLGIGRPTGGRQELSFDALQQTGHYYVHVEAKAGETRFPIHYQLRVDLTQTVPEPANPASVYTLILTDQPFIERAFQPDNAERSAWLRALQDLANHPRVRGRIIDLEGKDSDGKNILDENPALKAALRAWRADDTDALKANAVAKAIQRFIWDQRNTFVNLHYIVIAGDDRVIPFLRLPIVPGGLTGDGHSAGPGSGQHLGPDAGDGWRTEIEYPLGETASHRSTVGSALSEDFALTDDVYAAPAPQPYRGGDLFAVPDFHLPQLAVGRLVERPGAMTAVINAFLAADGQLPLSRTLVAGYDFMQDAAERADAQLAAAGVAGSRRASLLGGTWTADSLGGALFGTRRDLAFLAAHADHWRLYPPPLTPPAKSTPLAASAIQGNITGTVGIALACHAGLNVPPAWDAVNGRWDAGTGPPALDLPATWLGRGGTFVGSTGWAYGMAGVLGYQEVLLTDLNARLLDGDGMAVGDALVAAKQAYYNAHDLNAMHAKTLAGTVLYGLPMYRVHTRGGAGPRHTDRAAAIAIADAAPESLSAHLSRRHGVRYHFPATEMQRQTVSAGAGGTGGGTGGDGGVYDVFGGERPRIEAGEPIQPQHIEVRTEVSQSGVRQMPHGVILTSAHYRSETNFQPVVQGAFARGADESPQRLAPTFDPPGWHPTVPVSLRWLDDLPPAAGIPPAVRASGIAAQRASLVFYLGQYHKESRRERVFDELVLDEYYSDGIGAAGTVSGTASSTVSGTGSSTVSGTGFSTVSGTMSGTVSSTAVDETPPWVRAVRGQPVGDRLMLEVQASDATGIQGVVAAFANGETDGVGDWSSQDLAWDAARQAWAGKLPADAEVLIQVIDTAGNVAYDDNAGRYFTRLNILPPAPRASRVFLPLVVREPMPCRTEGTKADIVLVLDMSDSMNNFSLRGRPKREALIEAARKLIGALRLAPQPAAGMGTGSNRVAVVGFNDSAWIEQPLTGEVATANAALDRLTSKLLWHGGTRLDLAFERGAAAVAPHLRRPESMPVLIVLTDGLPSLAPPDQPDEASVVKATLAAAAAAKRQGSAVYIVGAGDPATADPGDRVNAELLRAYASHPSMFYLKRDVEAVGDIYLQIPQQIGCAPVDFWSGR